MARRRKRESGLEYAIRRGSTPMIQVAMQLMRGDYMGVEPNPYYRLHHKTAKEIETLMLYEAYLLVERARKAKMRPAQRRARQLLSEFLAAEERERIRRRNEFLVVGSAGGLYRVRVGSGKVDLVERHGGRHYGMVSYCHHDVEEKLPGADVALAHLLLLRADEPAFLEEANGHSTNTMLWNSEYLRDRSRIRRALPAGAELLHVCRIEEAG